MLDSFWRVSICWLEGERNVYHVYSIYGRLLVVSIPMKHEKFEPYNITYISSTCLLVILCTDVCVLETRWFPKLMSKSLMGFTFSPMC